jgi:hypothetical protein
MAPAAARTDHARQSRKQFEGERRGMSLRLLVSLDVSLFPCRLPDRCQKSCADPPGRVAEDTPMTFRRQTRLS